MRRLQVTTMIVMALTAIVVCVHVNPVGQAPGASLLAVADAARRSVHEEGMGVWGKIKRYTDSYVVVDEKSYKLAKNVVIDTYSLEKDPRGNVRLTLDANGRVAQMFFYGIDMPEVVRRYKM